MSILFKYPSEYLVYNAIQTPDGTVLESTHRHDYKEHVDSTNDCLYFVDGGLDYIRVCGAKSKDLTISTDDHMVARKYLKWGSRGKNGNEPLRYAPVCELTTNHIYNILKTQKNVLKQIHLCLTYELLYRAFNDSGWKSDLYGDE